MPPERSSRSFTTAGCSVTARADQAICAASTRSMHRRCRWRRRSSIASASTRASACRRFFACCRFRSHPTSTHGWSAPAGGVRAHQVLHVRLDVPAALPIAARMRWRSSMSAWVRSPRPRCSASPRPSISAPGRARAFAIRCRTPARWLRRGGEVVACGLVKLEAGSRRTVRGEHRDGVARAGPRASDRVGAAGRGGAAGRAHRLSAGDRGQRAGAGALRALRLPPRTNTGIGRGRESSIEATTACDERRPHPTMLAARSGRARRWRGVSCSRRRNRAPAAWSPARSPRSPAARLVRARIRHLFERGQVRRARRALATHRALRRGQRRNRVAMARGAAGRPRPTGRWRSPASPGPTGGSRRNRSERCGSPGPDRPA